MWMFMKNKPTFAGLKDGIFDCQPELEWVSQVSQSYSKYDMWQPGL
jgi:hypothetical protein